METLHNKNLENRKLIINKENRELGEFCSDSVSCHHLPSSISRRFVLVDFLVGDWSIWVRDVHSFTECNKHWHQINTFWVGDLGYHDGHYALQSCLDRLIWLLALSSRLFSSVDSSVTTWRALHHSALSHPVNFRGTQWHHRVRGVLGFSHTSLVVA